MADDVLFEFLHMEIVAHVYKEQATREDIDKVTWQVLIWQVCIGFQLLGTNSMGWLLKRLCYLFVYNFNWKKILLEPIQYV